MNQKDFDFLMQGVEAWNDWKKDLDASMQPDLAGADLAGFNLAGVDFIGMDLREVDFRNVFLSGANLLGAILNGVDLRAADLRDANLRAAYLNGADLASADLSGADLRRADLNGAILSGANLRGADLRDADLRAAYLIHAHLSGAHLSGAHLYEADLSYADLGGAHLYEANLERADLSRADLSRADLSRADLREADLSYADLGGAHLYKANLERADLSRADLSNAVLVDTDLTGATLTHCSIYGISVWNVQLEGATQDSLVITREDEPAITVDDLEVAQFIYLLLNHEKLRNVLNAVTQKGVLILGRFGDGGLEVLQAIAAKLREEKYLPILFDFERPQGSNYTETIKTLVGLARFVVADLSGPSVPQELYATVPHFKIPFVPIIEASRKPYSMAGDIFEYPWVISPPITFTTTEELLEQIPTKIIAPAEEKHQARQKKLDELFKEA